MGGGGRNQHEGVAYARPISRHPHRRAAAHRLRSAPLRGQGGDPSCLRAGAPRRIPRGPYRAAQGAGHVRRHHPRGVRRPEPPFHHVCRHRGGGLPRLDEPGRHPQHPHHGLLDDQDPRQRGAAVPSPARHGHWGAPGRPVHDRGQRRLRPPGDHHDRRPRRGRLRPQRHQDVRHQRRARQGLRRAHQDRHADQAAVQGHEHLHRGEGDHAGDDRWPPHRKAGLQGGRDHGALLRGRPRARRQPDRWRRGTGLVPHHVDY